ncbi:MAG: hypothetical protein DHS20C18_13980 [Saprospiraceae bacterium]|nr:MAG: hypothetical protein DHS20C18_13980 [Saprospiraceae bacterium]
MIIDPVSGDNLIGAWGRRYDSDDVIFYDEFGAPIDRTFGDGTFYFAPVIDPPAPIDTLLKKTFLLDLPPWTGYNRTDTDTIQIELILKPAECPKIEYNNLKVFYNDILFFDGIPSDGEKFTFHKE